MPEHHVPVPAPPVPRVRAANNGAPTRFWSLCTREGRERREPRTARVPVCPRTASRLGVQHQHQSSAVPFKGTVR